MDSGFLVDASQGVLKEGSGCFLWTRWRDVGCSRLYVPHIGFDLSYAGAVLLFWRVLHFLLLNRL